MRCTPLRSVALVAMALTMCAASQDGTTASAADSGHRPTPPEDFKGLPARSAPTDYQAVAKSGSLTIAAEFAGHSVPTSDAAYSTEDFVVVEAAVFGPPGAKATLSTSDFSLEISGKKGAESPAPYELVRGSLKDPEWAPPKPEAKSKTSINGGGEDTSTAPVHMPMDLRLAMEQHVRAAVMLQGERTLPQAGLLFFPYRGKTKNIRSLQLIYNGPTGKATLDLQP